MIAQADRYYVNKSREREGGKGQENEKKRDKERICSAYPSPSVNLPSPVLYSAWNIFNGQDAFSGV